MITTCSSTTTTTMLPATQRNIHVPWRFVDFVADVIIDDYKSLLLDSTLVGLQVIDDYLVVVIRRFIKTLKDVFSVNNTILVSNVGQWRITSRIAEFALGPPDFVIAVVNGLWLTSASHRPGVSCHLTILVFGSICRRRCIC